MTKNTIIYLSAFSSGFLCLAGPLLVHQYFIPVYGSTEKGFLTELLFSLTGIACGLWAGITIRNFSEKLLAVSFGFSAIIFFLMEKLVYRILVFRFADATIYNSLALSCFLISFLLLFSQGLIQRNLFLSGIRQDKPNLAEYPQESRKLGRWESVTGFIFFLIFSGALTGLILTCLFLWNGVGLNSTVVLTGISTALLNVFLILVTKKYKTFFFYLPLALLFIIIRFSFPKVLPPENKPITILKKQRGLNGFYTIAEQGTVGTRAVLFNSVAHGIVTNPNQKSFFPYVPRIAFYSSFLPIGSQILIAGLHSGTLAAELVQNGFSVTVCEPDVILQRLSVEYFQLHKNINILPAPIRKYAKMEKEKKFNLIVLDVLEGECQPHEYYTIEAFREYYGLLKPDGIIMVHFECALIGNGKEAVLNVFKSMEAAGFTGYPLNTEPVFEIPSSLLLAGSKKELDINKFSFRSNDYLSAFNFPSGDNWLLKGIDWYDGYSLTDDIPVMEKLYEPVSKEKRKVSKQLIYYQIIQQEEIWD